MYWCSRTYDSLSQAPRDGHRPRYGRRLPGCIQIPVSCLRSFLACVWMIARTHFPNKRSFCIFLYYFSKTRNQEKITPLLTVYFANVVFLSILYTFCSCLPFIWLKRGLGKGLIEAASIDVCIPDILSNCLDRMDAISLYIIIGRAYTSGTGNWT